MKRFRWTTRLVAAAVVGVGAWLGIVVGGARASDHGDAPNVAGDQAADLNDTYTFLDPNDNTKVILIMTFRGFIVPGEGVNFTAFDPNVLYRFEIENTGDPKPDETIDITFAPRTATSQPQAATVKLPGKKNQFIAQTTVATEEDAAPTPTITTDPSSGVSFFAGAVDDPFFFDVPAFARFLASVRAGAPDAAVFDRGRDTFAGYNTLAIALSVPSSLIKGAADNVRIGVDAVTLRKGQSVGKNGVIKGKGKAKGLDRAGNPAVNTVLIPFGRKDEYNASTPVDDAKGKFANDIVATLKSLGTDDEHIGILAGVAVANGDYERLNLTVINSGPGGGNNPQAAFPNGRRLADDVIDTYLTIIANGTALGDGVTANDVPFRDAFPFLGAPHQPLPSGTVDDLTRN